MRKFIVKTSYFILPFIALYMLNVFLYNPNEGDLIKVGYLYSNPSPKSTIERQYHLEKQYVPLSTIDLETNKKFDVIIIGDSFSEQESLGYKNFLANQGVSVLHIDRFISGTNPTQTLIQLLNSDLFNHISADYIVLQSVERSFNNRNEQIDFEKTMNLDTLSNQINNYKRTVEKRDFKFYSETILKIPLVNIQYHFEPNPGYSKTFKYKSTDRNLFSNPTNDLLFYQEDIKYLNQKNDSLSIQNSIQVIEEISDKAKMHNMELIMLVSPDKYDLYYPYIAGHNSLTKPLFFDIYEPANKKYINVDSYKILNEKMGSEKDLYYYDDTHWSPIAAKIIADELYHIIRK